MEQLDFLKIIEKIGVVKDMSKLTEEERLFYDMVQAIRSNSADDERKKIKEVINQYKQQQFIINTNENRINMKTSNRTWIGIAAGVAILVVAYFFLSKPSKSTDEIFKSSFNPHSEYLAVAREKAMQFGMASTATGGRDSFLTALKLYEENKYIEAIKILTPYVENYPEDNSGRYYLAMSHLNIEKYAPAITNLSLLNAKPDLDIALAEEVKWNLAITYMVMVDGKKQARALFEQLVKTEGRYSKKAKAQIDLIDSL